MVESGAEMNGYWQPWNATYNGLDQPTDKKGPDNGTSYLANNSIVSSPQSVEAYRTAIAGSGSIFVPLR